MSIEQLLRNLGITQTATKSKNGTYVIDIADMDEFGRYYSLLDRNKEVEEISDTSLLTIHNISLDYLYKKYQLSLISDNDQDSYRLVIIPLSDKDLERIEKEAEGEDTDEDEREED